MYSKVLAPLPSRAREGVPRAWLKNIPKEWVHRRWHVIALFEVKEKETSFTLSSDYAEGTLSKRICWRITRNNYLIPLGALYDLDLYMGVS